MKRTNKIYISIAILLMIAILINSCKEVGPIVPWGNNGNFTDTTYIESPVQTAQPKTALVEEITGVSCVNCPAAHVILENLITQYPSRVIGVAYHPGELLLGLLESPPPGTLQNMTSADAQSITSSAVFYPLSTGQNGFPDYAPAGSVDRITHPNAGPYQVTSAWDNAANWGGYVSTELSEASPVNIYLTTVYNTVGGTRNININVSLHYTTAQPDTDKLSVFLTEDSIVTAQLLANNADDTFYVHNHIMRAAVTNPLGNIINVPSFAAGRVYNVAFSYVIPPQDSVWNPAHMHVVAFVHQYLNGRNDILQSQIVKVIQ